MAEEKDAQRVYVVLRASADKTLYRHIGNVAAHSAAAACRAVVEQARARRRGAGVRRDPVADLAREPRDGQGRAAREGHDVLGSS